MITYNNRPSEKQYIAIAKEGTLAVDKIVSECHQMPPTKKPRQDREDKVKLIKDINEIFVVDIEGTTIKSKQSRFILIEGAPGIGKTVLAQHIALCWAKGEVLTEIDILFMLFLRDPDLQKVRTCRDFIRYVSMEDFSDKELAYFANELKNTKKVCFVLDGYDEYDNPKDRSFITDIINGGVFPNSLVVITSRPIATLTLHSDIRSLKKIEILGLAKEQRDEYISKACNSNNEIEELRKYLKQQPIINGLCYIPLYLAILLYLFKQHCLPESLTEMNEFFIIHTVYRYLSKYGKAFSDVVDKMTDLPIFKDYIVKMSTLAFQGLQNNQLVFKSTDIGFDIVSEQETKNGFGLLQVVQRYPKKGVGREISFNFLHFTMQEFLAAYYVTTLSDEKQSDCMKKTFWEQHYSYMWMMYVGLVGVKGNHFIEFISEGKTYKNSKKGLMITTAIKRDKKKRLHVFQCYMEARSSVAELPVAISSMFKDDKINFNNITLLSYHVSSLTSFMSTSSISVQWKTLELKNCRLDDNAMNILELFIVDNQEKTASFEIVDLSENLSSPWSAYCAIIKYCETNKLTLYGCTKYEFKHYINELKDSLETNSKLRVITLCDIKGSELPCIKEVLSCTTTLETLNFPVHQATDEILIQSNYNKVNINICGNFSNCTLESMDISDQNIDDQTVLLIAFGLQNNTVLKSLNMSQNSISDIGLLAVGSSLKDNDTLCELDLSNNPFTSQGIADFVKAIQINQKLNLRKLNVSELSISKDGARVIGDFVNSNRTLQHFTMSKLRGIGSDGANLFVNTCRNNETLCVLDISEINLTDDGAAAISSCIHHNVIQEMNLSNNKITKEGAKILAKAIKKNISLNTFDISANWINNKGIVCFLEKIIKNKNSKLKSLLVMGNMITKPCTRQMEELFKDIRVPLTVYSSESDLVLDTKGLMIETTELTISTSGLHKTEDSRKRAVKDIPNTEYRINFVCNCLVQNDRLTSVKLSKMEITSESAKEVAKVIDRNTVLQDLDISQNLLGDDGMLIICDSLKNNETLQTLNISKNKITSKGAKEVADAFNEKCKLKNLNISDNNISATGIIAIIDNNSSLQQLNVSNNNISEDIEKLKELSKAIQDNTNLKVLKILQDSPVCKPVFHEHILNALSYNSTMTLLQLPWLHENEEIVGNKVEEINEKRKHSGIEILKYTF